MPDSDIANNWSKYRTTLPRRKFLGWSSVWRENGTGTRDFYVFWLRIYRGDFAHSTTWFW